ncbi:MAG: LapA family protein [Marinicella sp.]|nr:LapA family protein [Xanthomonadales bacterium]
MSSLKKIFTLLIVLLLLVVAIAISSMNADSVLLNLHWYELNWPLGFTLLLFLSFGVVFGLVLAWLFWTWPAHREKMHWKRQYHQLQQFHEKEVAALQQKAYQEASEEVAKLP